MMTGDTIDCEAAAELSERLIAAGMPEMIPHVLWTGALPGGRQLLPPAVARPQLLDLTRRRDRPPRQPAGMT
jgi:hypothetical protein